MSENKLVGEFRTSFGKGSARKSRAAGRTPAVIYGHGSEPRHITLPAHEVALVLRHKNALIDLTIDGKEESVLVKSATKDAVTQIIEHIENKLDIKVGQTSADGMFTLKTAECLGACGYGPMLQCGKHYHEHLTPAKVDELLDTLRKEHSDK